MGTRSRLAIAWLPAGCLLAACDGPQNYMKAGGPAAAKLASLGAFTLIVFIVVSVIVLLLLLWVAVRRRGTLDWHAPLDADGGQRWILIGGIAVPVVVLAVIFVSSLQAMSHYPMSHDHDSRADYRVTGRQWWFNAEYLGETTQDMVSSPNELHIPVGRPIEIELRTQDVIHSFWIPKLHGKVDLVPGLINRIRIRADAPGVYSGQCGEYCGTQHSNMRLRVVAHSPDDFQQWLQAQRAKAQEPQTARQKAGEQVFMSSACVAQGSRHAGARAGRPGSHARRESPLHRWRHAPQQSREPASLDYARPGAQARLTDAGCHRVQWRAAQRPGGLSAKSEVGAAPADQARAGKKMRHGAPLLAPVRAERAPIVAVGMIEPGRDGKVAAIAWSGPCTPF
jgi:cytochrome c oxidase subunit 2